MRVIRTAKKSISLLRSRLASEDGFTILIALGVLVVTSLLAAAAYAAVQADAPLAQRDLSGKRAYYAARAGVNAFLYQLNQDPNYWQQCPSAPKTAIAPSPTSVTGESYSYSTVPANGKSACSPAPSGDPISTLIDETTGTFQMKFTGYAGTPEVQRGLIATFRKDTPLDYLWYTMYETLDPVTYPTPWPSGTDYNLCASWKRSGPGGGRPSYCRDINWITGDKLNGPAYTQDQYLIAGSPIFGRTAKDKIESMNPNEPDNPNSICVNSDCTSADMKGTPAPAAKTISPPNDNDQLKDDAGDFGIVVTGVTTITLNGTAGTATVKSCPVVPTSCTTVTPTIGRYSASPPKVPIIYVQNDPGGGCTSNSYTPYRVTYVYAGPCGNVYVHGDYKESLTIASAGDIIIDGNLTKLVMAPAPTLGLVANNFVRLMHGMTAGRPADADFGQCGTASNQTSSPDQTLEAPNIDAAILAIKHSFIVDNYDCGAPIPGNLNINGAIAQKFRGTVGTGGSSGAATGYIKNYTYDDRFAVAQPPYLFDIASSSWHIARETLCVPNGTASSTTCG